MKKHWLSSPFRAYNWLVNHEFEMPLDLSKRLRFDKFPEIQKAFQEVRDAQPRAYHFKGWVVSLSK